MITMAENKIGSPAKEVFGPIKEVLGELFSLLESMEARSDAILLFLKDSGTATEQKLAPYLQQAANASSVKWRAARRRMEYLLTPVEKSAPGPGPEEKKQERVEEKQHDAENTGDDRGKDSHEKKVQSDEAQTSAPLDEKSTSETPGSAARPAETKTPPSETSGVEDSNVGKPQSSNPASKEK
jgi:hypothetical protein